MQRSESSSEWNWSWGQLPEKQPGPNQKAQTGRFLGRMFNRMGSNPGENNSSATLKEEEDIYLDDTEVSKKPTLSRQQSKIISNKSIKKLRKNRY